MEASVHRDLVTYAEILGLEPQVDRGFNRTDCPYVVTFTTANRSFAEVRRARHASERGEA